MPANRVYLRPFHITLTDERHGQKLNLCAVKNWIGFIVLAWMGLFLHVPQYGYAQEVIFKALAAAQKVGVQDPFEVQFSIENVGDITSFDLPPLQGVQILNGPSRNIQYRQINGRKTVRVELTYVMKAKQVGPLHLGPAKATADGHTIRSNDIYIEVVQGSVLKQRRQQAPASPVFDPFEAFFGDDPFGEEAFEALRRQQQQMMRQMPGAGRPRPTVPKAEPIQAQDVHRHIFFVVETDKRDVYRGEQINVSYKLYTRLPMEINITKTPSLQGFWSQDFKLPDPPQPKKEIYQGKEYQVFEIKRTAIFPTQTGTLTLDPAMAEGVVRLMEQEAGTDWFDSFFGSLLLDDMDLQQMQAAYRDIPVKLSSEPIAIQVRELPEQGRPASFQGAVGQFNIETAIDKTEIHRNESAIVVIKIAGLGNLKLAGVPQIAFPKSLTVYEPKLSDTGSFTAQGMSAFREIRYTFTPNKEGVIQIPAGAFSFFDPERNTYTTLPTPSYTLNVLPEKSGKQFMHDIHDIVTRSIDAEQSSSSCLLHSYWFWSVYSLPLFGLLFLAFYKKPKPLEKPNLIKPSFDVPQKTKDDPGLSIAENFLRLGEHTPFYQEIIKAIWRPIQHRWPEIAAVPSREEAIKGLSKTTLNLSLQAELIRLTQACETALYSPDKGTLQMHQVYSDSLRLLSQIENQL